MNIETKTERPILAKIREDVKEYSDRDLHDQWDDCLDNTTDVVRVGSLEYAPSTVLKAVDPTAYRCGFVDWLDGERERIVEIEGAYYDRAEVESLLDEVEGEARVELESLEEIADEAEANGEGVDPENVAEQTRYRDAIAAVHRFRKLYL